MRVWLSGIVAIVFLIYGSGCTRIVDSAEEGNWLSGVIAKVAERGDRVVVNLESSGSGGDSDSQMMLLIDSQTEIIVRGGEAGQSGSPVELAAGQDVRFMWTGSVGLSNPPRATARRIVVLLPAAE